MDSVKTLTVVLVIIVGIIVMLLLILGALFLNARMKSKNDKPTAESDNKGEKIKGKTKRFKELKMDSVMNFMEFDSVIDNMISQKDGMRYIMVVECQGINYDLMSQVEKNAVEESFVQFLNTLRYPVQLYTQTRTINLDESIETYKKSIEETKVAYEKEEKRYYEMINSQRYSEEQIAKQYFELTKKKNLYEYGKDIINNTERMSKNKNVLNKKYYVIIPYFVEDLGDDKFDKIEQRNYAFSELYTRAQAVIRTLSSCGINGKVLNSNELVDLLYMAYNRDEAEVYGVEKALKAGYDELYTTAQDVIDKQIKALDEEIEEQALEKARNTVNEIKSEKQRALQHKKETKEDMIDELAKIIIEENKNVIGKSTAEASIERINRKKKEGGVKENVKVQKTRKATTKK